MSIALVVTAGMGNGTFNGSIPFIVTRGYNISTIIPSVIPDADGIVVGGMLGNGLAVTASLGNGVVVTSSLGSGIVAKGKL